LVVEFDCLDSRKLAFVDPIHQLPWSAAFIRDFLNLQLKKGSLGVFYNFLESLPVLQASGRPVFIERFATIFIPPLFGMFRSS